MISISKRKKLKYLIVLVNLLLVLGNRVCFADMEVFESGNYRLRSCASNMYMTCDKYVNKAYIKQTSYSNYNLPPSFKIFKSELPRATMEKSNLQGNCYFIQPDNYNNLIVNKYANTGVRLIDIRNQNVTSESAWVFEYEADGAFNIKSVTDNFYIGVLNRKINNDGAMVSLLYKTQLGNKKWFIEKDVPDAVYRIKNKASGKYLTAIVGQPLSCKSYNSLSNQQFKISTSNDGYSDIMPYADDDYSISVAGWDIGQDNENASVRLEVGQSSEGQAWKFLVNNDGSLRIMSQLSDCNKCITVKNNSLRSVTYNESDESCKWQLEKVPMRYDKKIFIAAFWKKGDGSGEYDRRTIIAPIKKYYEDQDEENIVTTCNASLDSNYLINALKQNQVVSISSHGYKDRIIMYDSNGLSVNSPEQSVTSDSVYLAKQDIERKCSDLSNLKICLFAGCMTANGENNITQIVHNKGAKCSIGFVKETTRPHSTFWVKSFNEMIAKGGCVDLALGYADVQVILNKEGTGNTNCYEVYGDKGVSLGD